MTLSRSRWSKLFAASLCMAVAGLAGAQSASAKTYGCPTPKEPAGLKGGYFTELRVSGYKTKKSACRSGRSLVLSYYRCRTKRGGMKGTCNNRTVNGLKCKESRPRNLQSDTQINARVTCRKGSKRIRHSYQQNLRSS